MSVSWKRFPATCSSVSGAALTGRRLSTFQIPCAPPIWGERPKKAGRRLPGPARPSKAEKGTPPRRAMRRCPHVSHTPQASRNSNAQHGKDAYPGGVAIFSANSNDGRCSRCAPSPAMYRRARRSDLRAAGGAAGSSTCRLTGASLAGEWDLPSAPRRSADQPASSSRATAAERTRCSRSPCPADAVGDSTASPSCLRPEHPRPPPRTRRPTRCCSTAGPAAARTIASPVTRQLRQRLGAARRGPEDAAARTAGDGVWRVAKFGRYKPPGERKPVGTTGPEDRPSRQLDLPSSRSAYFSGCPAIAAERSRYCSHSVPHSASTLTSSALARSTWPFSA